MANDDKNQRPIRLEKTYLSKVDDVIKFVWRSNRTGYIFESVDLGIGEGGRNERRVQCISVQSGCPVGCNFCGTGNYFLGNLTSKEIVDQVIQTNEYYTELAPEQSDLYQIMFMSMGEPAFNYKNVRKAIEEFKKLYPYHQPLISTVGIKNNAFDNWLEIGKKIDLGLQFSVHASTNEYRDRLIPFKRKYTVEEISEKGEKWTETTGRLTYISYCIINGKNDGVDDIKRLMRLFPKEYFHISLSWMNPHPLNNYYSPPLKRFKMLENILKNEGYDASIFKSAGLDVGGGCGQLLFIQDELKKLWEEKKAKRKAASLTSNPKVLENNTQVQFSETFKYKL